MITGGLVGGALGGAFSVIPITGLYRTGGMRFNPFSGQAVMPRFMLAGPWSPLQSNWRPPPEFNALPANKLPVITENYAWARINNQWELLSLNGPARESFILQTYRDGNGNINYNLVRQNGQQLSSYANTRPQGNTYGGNRNFPMTTGDFQEPNGTPWVRGHNVDHADTIDTPGSVNSTTDPLNFTPEPSWWGLGPRNTLVARARAAGGSYKQMNYYSSSPRLTNNGTPIPDGVYFVTYDAAGNPTAAFRVPFAQQGPRRIDPFLAGGYDIPLTSIPSPLLKAPTINPGVSVGGGGGANQNNSGNP
jgi:hypothetical protein